MLRSAFRGGLTGALAGPLCMLLYIFLVRFVFEYVWILAEPGRWRAHLRGAAQAVADDQLGVTGGEAPDGRGAGVVAEPRGDGPQHRRRRPGGGLGGQSGG